MPHSRPSEQRFVGHVVALLLLTLLVSPLLPSMPPTLHAQPGVAGTDSRETGLNEGQFPSDFPWPMEALAYSQYPPYREVLSALFRLAGREHIALPDRWRLLKHPEGWVVKRWDVQENQVDQDLTLLLWSREEGRFLNATDLKLQSNPFRPFAFGEDADGMMRQAFADWDRETNFYDIAFFYGYPSAMRHSIAVLGASGELEAPQLLALARAHAQEGRRILNPKGLGFPLGNLDNPSPAAKDSLDRADRHILTATHLYAELARREPEYPTLIGTARLEAAASNTSSWMRWRLNGQEDRAAPYLAKTRFHPFLEAAGYNMLSACRDSSILFTHGDVDSYLPLLIQHRDGYRKDVTIVSLSLLAMPEYRQQVAEGLWGPALPALLEAPLNWASPEASSYTITDRSAGSMPWADALLAWSQGRDTLPGLLEGWCALTEALDLPLRWASAAEWAELAVLDAAQRMGRPVAYSMFVPQQRPYGGLYQHSHLEGLVHRFLWEPLRSEQEAGLRRLSQQAIDVYRFPPGRTRVALRTPCHEPDRGLPLYGRRCRLRFGRIGRYRGGLAPGQRALAPLARMGLPARTRRSRHGGLALYPRQPGPRGRTGRSPVQGPGPATRLRRTRRGPRWPGSPC